MDCKEEFILKVTSQLSHLFKNDEVKIINSVVWVTLGGYTMSKVTTELALPDEQDNFKLLKMFLMSKKVEGCTDRTIKYYGEEISKFLIDVKKPIKDITANDIRTHLARMVIEDKVSEVTSNNRRRNISSFFTWLLAEEYISKNPMLKVKQIKTEKLVKKPLSDEEVEILRNGATNERDKAIIETFLSTGMRVGEIAQCDRKDIQEDQMIVYGKGRKERYVYLNAKARVAIKNYLKKREDDNPALFVSLDKPHNRLRPAAYEVMVRELGRRLGIEKVHPHRLRRTAATTALNRGMPIEQVRQMLGHEQLDTTLIYAQSSQENLKASHKKYVT